ncbi:MAG: hypothetical protein ACD_81C00219G0010 [uncultured bacterium]|uniref:Uncharacterized protein n=2 Tax=Candidatus Wolfeibacteriota TaxID=1752735 RepID=A0A0G1HB11_9BACT|nr:MAG: hypothetical protein ACD_81C00219G0010 [uncultured bacterium]KKR12767.1 MAG: hypothetical protein UT41_C0001G0311 [Candidatus Wolfebacteria bacterium GW2011_GWC2_39_22]KKT43698.1 MAG: hypothetical protein UW32_C0001G0290 [Candidatus Wolfebacteria bacterium GW2011_GWE2_44_13]HBI25572.1 hypothetical protein [Candidatus Wolfebacteria bacterium]
MNFSSLQALLSSGIDLIPFAFFVVMVISAGYVYLRSPLLGGQRLAVFTRLIVAVVSFRIAFAAAKSGLQYYAWVQDELGKLLLPPTQPITYFFQYIWTHFWANVVLSLGVGLLTFIVLRTLQKKNQRFFDVGEVELGTLLALVVGWPHFVVFVPLVFVLVVLISIIRGIVVKEPFTTLGLPFIVAACIALFTAVPVLTFLHLEEWIM